jgi:hypothetical protein
VRFVGGPASFSGRIYVLTDDRRLLSSDIVSVGDGSTAVGDWIDWSANLDDVITDFDAHFSFLAVGDRK